MQLYLLYHHVHQPLQGLFLYFIIYRSFELVSSKEFDEEEDMTKIEPIPTLDFTKLHYLELGYRMPRGRKISISKDVPDLIRSIKGILSDGSNEEKQ